MPTVIHELADAFLRRKQALAERGQAKTKLAGSDYFMPKSAKQDLANRLSVFEQGGLPELLKQGASEMYHNPIVNTAISLTPGAGDVQSGYEAVQSAKQGNWGEAGLNALGVLPFIPALGGMTKLAKNEKIINVPISQIEHGESAMPGGKLTWPGSKELIKEYANMPTEIPAIRAIPPDADNPLWMIEDGSHRYEAAKLRGMKEIPVIINEAPIDYRMAHTAPNREFGAQLHDLSAIYPEDIYSTKAAHYYGGGGDAAWRRMDNESVRIAQSFRGKPDADVTIYRAVPKDEKITAINPGDWVTINKDYARTHGESNLPEGYKIISQKVKAKDIWTNADSVHEYGYDPQL